MLIPSIDNLEQVTSFFNTKYPGLDYSKEQLLTWKDHQKWLAVLSTSQTARTFRQRFVQFPELDIATMQTWNFTSSG
ncbi:unnamed protein product [Rhizophagus irregularis]|uniref:Uncharacterized protein n=1 Tax=Rhizophagus irregularis TaxID=588596 RepID=A0A915Z004_9GLOM|nr:unnamed protein product [Rhizophagus irregularis]